jgi:hypothetical protein
VPEAGASGTTPRVAVATPSMMLSRLVIIVAPHAGDKYNYRSQLAPFLSLSPVTNCVSTANQLKGLITPTAVHFCLLGVRLNLSQCTMLDPGFPD